MNNKGYQKAKEQDARLAKEITYPEVEGLNLSNLLIYSCHHLKERYS